MEIIGTTDGRQILIDDDDVCMAEWKWHTKPGKRGVRYAYRFGENIDEAKIVYFHRQLLGLKRTDDILVDHHDRDGLNNQRSNLRKSTCSQNQANSVKYARSGASSHLKGVSYHAKTGKWRARIKINRVGKTLGYFDSPQEAAAAYNAAAISAFGEFARVNPPPFE